MFTGLVEGMGRITALTPEGPGLRLVITPPADMVSDADPCRMGESVAINGCCLTVVAMEHGTWSFQAGTETLSKTNLGRLKVGHPVNLERALPAKGRLGGHFVQGHVDGVGTVQAIDRDGDWITMTFRLPEALAKQLVPKGSITVDGVSLTVVTVTAEAFSIALIPHTLAVTTLGVRGVGDAVNLETDILGKYVRQFMSPLFPG
ncbi:MAG TPA: riboflavin synthase [Planctomycetaceae bacterium]|nr:riboflavin synthase [Planctomycetaceae bacterium]